ncbi:unnamed protein product [Closterium sp. NIES-54]
MPPRWTAKGQPPVPPPCCMLICQFPSHASPGHCYRGRESEWQLNVCSQDGRRGGSHVRRHTCLLFIAHHPMLLPVAVPCRSQP